MSEDWRDLTKVSTPALVRRLPDIESGARVNWENFVHFRDDPASQADNAHEYRVGFWAGLAQESYGFAREVRDELLRRSSPVTLP
jgi:hypothetical protein